MKRDHNRRGSIGVACAAALLASSQVAAAAEPAAAGWNDWAALLGEWEADASPDGATGSFTLAADLDGQVLVRRNRADYPPGKGAPAVHHTDLMVVYKDGQATRADYWDSEGHAIHYAVSIEKLDGQPASCANTRTRLRRRSLGHRRYSARGLVAAG